MVVDREPLHTRRGAEDRPPVGLSPEMPIIGPEAHASALTVLAYGPNAFLEKKIATADEVLEYLGRWPVVWLNVDGLGTESVLVRLADIFQIHVLALKEIGNIHQRAKIELYEHNLFVVVRMMSMTDPMQSEQVSIVVGAN